MGADVRDFVEAIRERVRIEELAAAATQLSGGSRPVGLCPFHNEDGPSFTVYPEEGRWKCFGCGKGGSVFDFVMEREGLDFWGAALWLGEKHGIPAPEVQNRDTAALEREQASRRLLSEYVRVSHEALLKNEAALGYLKERGITEESVREYQLGVGVPIRKAEARKRAIEAGLIVEKDGREFELMKGRLIFPIIYNGRVANINGRAFDGPSIHAPERALRAGGSSTSTSTSTSTSRSGGRQGPKYISLAKAAIVPMGAHRLRGREAVIVEGPIDKILLDQAGYPACATISDKFSRDWLRLVGADTRLVLCYDADENQAGQTANETAGRLLWEAGHHVEVIELPVPHDPASFVQEQGAEAFGRLMAGALPYVSYWMRRRPERPGAGALEKILREAYELIGRADRGVQGRFVKELAARYGLAAADVKRGLAEWEKKSSSTSTSTSTSTSRSTSGNGSAEEDDGRPVIMADCEDLPLVQAQCWAAVRAANEPEPRYFRQGRVPVRLVKNDKNLTVVERFSLDIARHELSEIVNWRRTIHAKSGEFTVPAKPQDVQVKNFLSVRNVPLPVLSAIAEVPMCGPDGSIQLEPGYHAASEIYYEPAPGLEVPTVPETPNDADLARAREIIEDIICDFPFKSPSDKSHALALWILPFVRQMIHGPTPMHMVEAPIPGTGKSLLMDVLLSCSAGRHVGTITEARDDDEWRKRLTALLVRGQMVVKLDNVSRMLDSGVLASALVESVWQERLLGGNVMIDVPINCIWCCTANNPGMTTEIARRCVRIRIDPMRDKPWERGGFRHEDLRTFAEQTRGQMIWAALTMVRAWVTRGRKPFTGRVIGSYEEWTRTIGGILECAGIEGFLANYVEFLEQADMEGQVWRAFVRQWWDRFRDKPVGVSELFELAGEDSELFSFGKISKQGMKSAMGRRLAKQRDRVVGDWRIMQCPTMRARAIQWMLMRVSETEEPEDEIEPVQVLGPEQPALLDDEENPFGEEDEEE